MILKRQKRVLPGFGLSLGTSLFFTCTGNIPVLSQVIISFFRYHKPEIYPVE